MLPIFASNAADRLDVADSPVHGRHLLDLLGQLSGGGQHDGHRAAILRPPSSAAHRLLFLTVSFPPGRSLGCSLIHDVCEGGQDEREGFPRTRLANANHIAAIQCDGQGLIRWQS